MHLGTLDFTVVAIYAFALLFIAQWVSREKKRPPKRHERLLSCGSGVALVGYRRLTDCREYFGRTDHRHVGLSLCHGHRNRVL